MEKACALIFFALISLCNARSPPLPSPKPIALDCNATESQAGLALDLINEARDEGFVLKPYRVVRAYRQEKPGGGSTYYLTVDVLETKCSVLSGVSWKNCTDDVSFHNTIFGRCKAVIFISRPWRILKLIRYNCTLSPVPSRAIVGICPDCPTIIRDITPEFIAKAERLVEKYNEASNNTNYFKILHVERVRMQWVFGPSHFLSFTIKETDCLKTQDDVVLSNCNFLPDKDADVGYCTGSIWRHPVQSEGSSVSCEIYEPKDDVDDDHHHEHHKCTQQSVDPKPEVHQVPEQHKEQNENQGKGHKPSLTHHEDNCRPHHHHNRHPHHDHHRHHHGHHPHHHDHHHDHPHPHGHHHHHHVQGHNHTSSEKQGSSSEEHTDKKTYITKSKGSIEIIYVDDDGVLQEPTIAHQTSGKHHQFVIDFPDPTSHLETCPGEPKEELPLISKYFPVEK